MPCGASGVDASADVALSAAAATAAVAARKRRGIHRKLHKGDGIGGAKRGGFACR
ncbi:hypothetical protein BURPS1655_A2306 [Burkholderia pseudomallei 1655]|nr:hypothetical protein BURPS1655_A2306 [Burkholderia pseudomallei 1655]